MTKPNLKKLIASRKFDWVNPNIGKADWGTPKKIGTDYKLFHFDRYISSEDAIKKMEKEGYRPASIYELLSWTGWNDKDVVVALGSVGKVDGRRDVSCLLGDDSERGLGLGWWGRDWYADCRFLAVRNGFQELGDSESGRLDTLNLESAIKVVKDAGYEIRIENESTPIGKFQKERTDAMSDMLDRDGNCGTIHSTSRFYAKLDDCVRSLLEEKNREILSYKLTAENKGREIEKELVKAIEAIDMENMTTGGFRRKALEIIKKI